MKHYLVIDGGTTNLRIFLTDEFGHVRFTAKQQIGAAKTAISGSNAALRLAVRECMETVLQAAGLSFANISGCVAYGMITCASGLMEVPHLCAPAQPSCFRKQLVSASFEEIAPFPITFIPGLKNLAEPVTPDNLLQMDMMRGEETEAIGFFRLASPRQSCVLVLPGSHTKLVAMDEHGAILRCMTTISGELLSALTHHTILSEAVGARFVQQEQYDREWMLAGANACRAGISRAAFSARILHTLGGLPKEKAASFLLGTVLSSDLEALKAFGMSSGELYVAGKEPLQQALCDLFQFNGFCTSPVSEDITARMGVVGALSITGWLQENPISA